MLSGEEMIFPHEESSLPEPIVQYLVASQPGGLGKIASTVILTRIVDLIHARAILLMLLVMCCAGKVDETGGEVFHGW